MPDTFDAAWQRSFRTAVLKWYKSHGRQLPWRVSAVPYRIWISEIMLQQTTVAAVIPYFDRFISRFPDVHSLASAEQADVLRLWEGLGYYSRARNLHKAAQMIVDQYAGEFPAALEDLMTLPGVGRYTAGAIASFAFHQHAPIVEANTARLYARLLALREPTASTAGQKALWQFAEWIASPATAGKKSGRDPEAANFNQAVMDIGSSVCRPVDPDCGNCPLVKFCGSVKAGLQAQIPVAKPRPEFTQLHEISLAVRHGNQWLLRECQPGERWTGLWDFIRFQVPAEHFEPSSLQNFGIPSPESRNLKKAVRRGKEQPSLFHETGVPTFESPFWTAMVKERTGLQITRFEFSQWIRHTVTRYHIQLLCLNALTDHSELRIDSGYQWMSREQVDSLPLSTTARKVAKSI
ncbi:MAG: A/G-specific adenine glycosylase [Planctomycetaceae bacterium]|nr:A/G-specific adenine glycosylase [Planctomycetaceae bacterium]